MGLEEVLVAAQTVRTSHFNAFDHSLLDLVCVVESVVVRAEELSDDVGAQVAVRAFVFDYTSVKLGLDKLSGPLNCYW